MEKEFVPYELALRLKALGFDEPCFGFWSKIHGLFITTTSGKLNEDTGECLAPTFSQAFRWFREKYRLNGLLNHYPNTKEWDCSVHNLEWSGKELMEYIKTEDRSLRYPEHEEAELACLEKLIEIVKNK
jgi:hypothetical protein